MSQNNREQLRQQQAAQAKSQRTMRIVGIGAAILAAVLIAVFAVVLVQSQSSGTAGGGTRPPNATADGKAIVVNPGKAAQGAPLVELFFDYQCPTCKQFESLYGAELNRLAEAGEIQLNYRTMTFLDTNLGNDSSIRAGVAAACADIAGSYSAFHDEIYANQPENEGDGYTDEALRVTIPGTVGISGEKLTAFQACYDTQATKGFVQGTNEAAGKDGVTGTPTFHVNGKDVPLAEFASVTADTLGDLIKQKA